MDSKSHWVASQTRPKFRGPMTTLRQLWEAIKLRLKRMKNQLLREPSAATP